MVQTYGKNPFHFCDKNESDIIIPIELRIFDILNITIRQLYCANEYNKEILKQKRDAITTSLL